MAGEELEFLATDGTGRVDQQRDLAECVLGLHGGQVEAKRSVFFVRTLPRGFALRYVVHEALKDVLPRRTDVQHLVDDALQVARHLPLHLGRLRCLSDFHLGLGFDFGALGLAKIAVAVHEVIADTIAAGTVAIARTVVFRHTLVDRLRRVCLNVSVDVRTAVAVDTTFDRLADTIHKQVVVDPRVTGHVPLARRTGAATDEVHLDHVEHLVNEGEHTLRNGQRLDELRVVVDLAARIHRKRTLVYRLQLATQQDRCEERLVHDDDCSRFLEFLFGCHFISFQSVNKERGRLRYTPAQACPTTCFLHLHDQQRPSRVRSIRLTTRPRC